MNRQQILTGDCREVLLHPRKSVHHAARHPLLVAERDVFIREGEIWQGDNLAAMMWHFTRTSDFRAMFFGVRLEQSKRDNSFSLFSFNSKIWQQRLQYLFGPCVRC